jgi:hypothetical protein
MFIRKKGNYYHLVHSHRVNGRVRQKIVAYLGRCETIEERLYYLSRFGNGPCPEMKPRDPGWKERRQIANRLNLTEEAFAEEENLEKSGGELAYSAFSKWSDQKIAAYMKAECERDFAREAKRIDNIQRQRIKLWSLVPRGERARVKAYIKMREAQDNRKYQELLQEMSQKLKR